MQGNGMHCRNPQDVAVSSGSACTSASLEPSYVLRALGVDEDMAHTSLRFGLGRFTTEAEVRFPSDALHPHRLSICLGADHVDVPHTSLRISLAIRFCA